jgi:hypothetical protein
MKSLRKLICEPIKTAKGRQVHVSRGGARALVFDPTRTVGIGSAAASHDTRW